MRISSIRIHFAAHLAALVVAGAVFNAPDASACAVLPIEGADAPSLSLERVALLYDESKQLEHFVREVTFDGASSAFAFVVPTPSKPQIEAASSTLFRSLESAFPLDPPQEYSADEKSATTPASVQVLEEKRVGSFTAFTLAASDAAALDAWLKENRITLPLGGKEWLEHYVGLKFFFAAFRYEGRAKPEAPPDADSTHAAPPDEPEMGPPSRRPRSTMTSETVRLSFGTPVPFFPYLEPDHERRSALIPGM